MVESDSDEMLDSSSEEDGIRCDGEDPELDPEVECNVVSWSYSVSSLLVARGRDASVQIHSVCVYVFVCLFGIVKGL